MTPPFRLAEENAGLFDAWRRHPADGGVPTAAAGYFIRSCGTSGGLVIEARMAGSGPRVIYAGHAVIAALGCDPASLTVQEAFGLGIDADVTAVRESLYARPAIVVSHATLPGAPGGPLMQLELLMLPFITRATGEPGYVHGNAIETAQNPQDLHVTRTLGQRRIVLRRFYDPHSLAERASPLTIS